MRGRSTALPEDEMSRALKQAQAQLEATAGRSGKGIGVHTFFSRAQRFLAVDKEEARPQRSTAPGAHTRTHPA